MMRERLEAWWRRHWLKVPLRSRMPVRDGALWLGARLCDLAAWLDCMTVGTPAETFDALRRFFEANPDLPWEEGDDDR